VTSDSDVGPSGPGGPGDAVTGGRILDSVLKVIGALIPSAGLLLLFWMALRAIVQADRRERAAEAKWNREHGGPAPGAAAGGERPEASGGVAEAGETGHPTTAASAVESPDGETGSPA
jgi:hypothetical protein